MYIFKFLFFILTFTSLFSYELEEKLPLTPEDVALYVEKAKEHIQTTLLNTTTSSSEIEKYWNQFGSEILENFRVMTYISLSDFPGNRAAEKAMDELKAYLYQAITNNSQLHQDVFTYLNHSLKEKTYSPYEHYQFHCLIEELEKILLKDSDKAALNELKKFNALHEMAPFIYKKEEALHSFSNELTILSLNTCFMPGHFPLLFGGVLTSWQKRVDPLSEKIISSNADIVCLQEMFSKEAAVALYEKLKSKYSYFYIAIGPRVLGFDLDTVGLPSGLFVASKLPINKPKFTLFPMHGFPMNWGFFDFIVEKDNESQAHIYTTHLQSLNFPTFAEIRAEQLNYILNKMENDYAENNRIPYFLCGDLNIPYGSQEPAEGIIRSKFIDDYNKNGDGLSPHHHTCTDYMTNYYFSQSKAQSDIDPNYQILDYALLLNACDDHFEVQTKTILMNDFLYPYEAISDHHGLVSHIQKKQGGAKP